MVKARLGQVYLLFFRFRLFLPLWIIRFWQRIHLLLDYVNYRGVSRSMSNIKSIVS